MQITIGPAASAAEAASMIDDAYIGSYISEVGNGMWKYEKHHLYSWVIAQVSLTP